MSPFPIMTGVGLLGFLLMGLVDPPCGYPCPISPTVELSNSSHQIYSESSYLLLAPDFSKSSYLMLDINNSANAEAGFRDIIDIYNWTKRYNYKPAKNPARNLCPISSTNQDLPHDSASHPKARGLLSGIWDTGTHKEDQRGPSGGSPAGRL